MRKLLLLTTFILALTFSSSASFAEWKKVSSSGGGANTFFLDLERIRKHGGFVYFWSLEDWIKPDKRGYVSSKTYHKGDCNLFRYSFLSISDYKEPMGRGTGRNATYNDNEWSYPSPNSVGERVFKYVCAHAKKLR